MEDFDFQNPPLDPAKIAHILARTMIEQKGLGLAAPQIGLPVRAFVMMSNPVLCCFNPKIVDRTSKMIILEEVCLTFRNLVLYIERPEIIKVRYTLPNGETVTQKLIGMSSRIFQHELDHLNGILFTSRVSSLKLDIAKRKAAKLNR